MKDKGSTCEAPCQTKECSTSAIITSYACGCVGVKLYSRNEGKLPVPCPQCMRLHDLKERCGQHGKPKKRKLFD